MAPKYVMVGGISLDWVITADGQVAIKKCGGNALYSAAGAHFWNDQIAVQGHMGQDYPASYMESFREAGIDMAGIRQIDEPHEMMFAARYDADGRRKGFMPHEVLPGMGFDCPEAIEVHDYAPDRKNAESTLKFNPSPDETPECYWNANGFHIAGMYSPTQIAFSKELFRRGIPFTLDPSTSKASHILSNTDCSLLLGMATVFMPSEDQIDWFTDETDLEKALDVFAAYGPQVVLIKMGRRGCLVYDVRKKVRIHIPVYPTHAKDPTGAGDSFCGGFLVGYLETGDPVEAALRATISSSYVIEDFDARYGLTIAKSDAEKRLNVLRKSLP